MLEKHFFLLTLLNQASISHLLKIEIVHIVPISWPSSPTLVVLPHLICKPTCADNYLLSHLRS